MPEYVELHARSAFSFLQGASNPEELAGLCAQLGMPAIALLDRDGFYGAPRFHMAARKAGVRAHIGAEITCIDGRRLPLLTENRVGYQNLCRLITRMKLRAKKGAGAASLDEIAEHAGGLICLAAETDRDALARLLALFPRGQVYAEVERHLHRGEEARTQAIVETARALGVPLVATNGVRYALPAQRQILDVFTCIRHKVVLETAGRLLEHNAERHLKTTAEMTRLFADLPEAIAATGEISSRLQFTLADLGYEFPRYPVPEGDTMDTFLRKRALEGARDRYRPLYPRALAQIEHELQLIEKLRLSGYFLIVWDLVQFCRREGILVQGRGSAANSAVCYSLGITAVDPVGMELLFERFLSDERGEWPDIDLDLPSGDQRERVIQYLYQLYGKLGAAMTANVITYRGRSAAREVGKALGFEVATLDRLSSLVRGWEWRDPKDTTARHFRDAGLDLSNPRIRKFFDLYEAIQDLPRHLGQHSGGMVVCQGQLDAVVPLEPATMPGRVVVQWDKDDCADMGIVKVDLLGLGMMAVIEDSIRLIRESYGEEVDLAHLPADDPKVYTALQKADTIGLFQVESRAQMSCLPRHSPTKFYDIVVQVALIRPGPIVGNMVHPYLKRRQGREAPDCMHPSLEPVLRRTLGVPLFQEQLLRMAMIAAGFTGGQAEELRRAFGFKRSEKRMREVEVKLREGMAKNQITGPVQDRIVQSITSFALYGFPESHAASFALIAYASAYLKCHYLAAFLTAMLNNQPMGFYHPAVLVKDAQRHGLRVLPVDIAISQWECVVEQRDGQHCLRLGFLYVKGLREECGRAIVLERAHGPFSGIEDLARRVPLLRKPELNQLAAVGALNSPNQIHRRDALWQTQRAARPSGPLLEQWHEPDPVSPLARMTVEERMHADYTGTGVNIGRHPLAYRHEEMNALGVRRAFELPHIRNGMAVKVAGSVVVRQRPGTAKGFVFLSMEDETGIMNVIVTPDLFDENRFILVSEPFLLIEGTLQNIDNTVSVKAARILPLEARSGAAPSHDFH